MTRLRIPYPELQLRDIWYVPQVNTIESDSSDAFFVLSELVSEMIIDLLVNDSTSNLSEFEEHGLIEILFDIGNLISDESFAHRKLTAIEFTPDGSTFLILE